MDVGGEKNRELKQKIENKTIRRHQAAVLHRLTAESFPGENKVISN